MRISMEDADKVENNSNRSSFFKLKSNGSKAVVRFLHEGMHDIPTVVVHSITEKGRHRWINCIRESVDSPRCDCPLCSSDNPDVSQISTRVYLELAVYETDSRGVPTGKYTKQIWERGKKFISKIQSLCNRYKPLCDYVFEIERLGEERSTETTYEIYPIPAATKEEYPYELEPEPFDPIGSIVLNKNKQEIEYFLDNGDFPPVDKKENGVVRREAVQTTEQAASQSTNYVEQPRYENSSTQSPVETPVRRTVENAPVQAQPSEDTMIRRRRF